MTEQPLRVVFRLLEGIPIALFPDVPFDPSGNIMSYQRVGQHGAASPALVDDLPKASPAEYESLLRELMVIYDHNLEPEEDDLDE